MARGARVLAIETELEIDEAVTGDPWESYFAVRFAWPDEAAEIYRDVGGVRQFTEAKRLEAAHYLELSASRNRTTVLTGGLPYHRRSGPRMLDCLLVVAGETRRRFRYGVGLDLAHPMQQALELLQPIVTIRQSIRPAGPHASNWLFHVDAKNVVATHWSTLRTGDRADGFRVRLLETEGLSGRVRLRALRDVTSGAAREFSRRDAG